MFAVESKTAEWVDDYKAKLYGLCAAFEESADIPALPTIESGDDLAALLELADQIGGTSYERNSRFSRWRADAEHRIAQQFRALMAAGDKVESAIVESINSGRRADDAGWLASPLIGAARLHLVNEKNEQQYVGVAKSKATGAVLSALGHIVPLIVGRHGEGWVLGTYAFGRTVRPAYRIRSVELLMDQMSAGLLSVRE